MKKKKYWIRFWWGSCPVCGADKSYRERVYGKKPKNVYTRHIYLSDMDCYDYCDAL